MTDILIAIETHPWSFIGLVIGSCWVASALGEAIGKVRK